METNADSLAAILGEEKGQSVRVAGRDFFLSPASPEVYLQTQLLLVDSREAGGSTELPVLAVSATTGLDRTQTLNLLRVATARGEHKDLISAAYDMVGMPPPKPVPELWEVLEQLQAEVVEGCKAPHTDTGQVPEPVLEVLKRYRQRHPKPVDEGTADEVFS